MKNELDEKIMADSVAFRTKKYNYLLEDGSENQETKDTIKCVIKLSKTNQKNVYKQINSKTK